MLSLRYLILRWRCPLRAKRQEWSSERKILGAVVWDTEGWHWSCSLGHSRRGSTQRVGEYSEGVRNSILLKTSARFIQSILYPSDWFRIFHTHTFVLKMHLYVFFAICIYQEHHLCSWCPQKPEEIIESSETRVVHWCELPWRFWVLKPLGLLQEQQMSLTIEPSLQSNKSLFSQWNAIWLNVSNYKL